QPPDDEAMERSFGQMLSHVSKKKLCFGWPRNAIKEEKLLDKASDRADAYAATLSTSVILSDTDRKNSAKRHHSSRKGPCNPREPSRQLFEGGNEALDVPVEPDGIGPPEGTRVMTEPRVRVDRPPLGPVHGGHDMSPSEE